jgi:predicted nucleic acid-binding protein
VSARIYVDASAIVKLVLEEPESAEMLRWFVEAPYAVTSRVGVVETRRAASRRPHDARHRERVLEDVEVLELTPEIAAAAAMIQPPAIRTLDAIHLASALAIATDIDAFVTYDDRLAEAARTLGLPVVRPA